MKHRTLYAWLMIALFAVVSFGGCGGSSDSGLSGPERTTQSNVSMKEAIDSADVFQKIVDQILSNDLILLGLAGAKVYTLEVSNDGQIWTQELSVLEEDTAPALYDVDALRRHYDSEDVIILAEADIGFINKIRCELGEVSEDSGIIGPSGILDAYAMIRINDGKTFHSFTYTVPTMEDIINSDGTSTQQDSSQSIGDILSTDSAPASADENGAAYTAVDFVAERWVNLFTWISASGFYRAFKYINASVIASAAQSLTDAADSQSYTFDFSYNNLPAEGITYDDWNNSVMAFTRSRTNSLNLNIYAAHSFQTGNDYYFIQSAASTTPKNYKSVKVSPTGSGTAPYLYGYTKYLGFEAWLDGSTASNVSLVASNPGSLKGSPLTGGPQYSATTSYNINSWAGLLQYTGPYAVEGVNYSNTKNWTPYGYDIVKNNGATHPSSAGWYADSYLPAVMWGTLTPSGGTTGTLTYNADWVWEVKPSFWKSHKTVKLNVDFDVRDGATIASFTQGGSQHDRADKWFGSKQTASLILTPPPHVSANLMGRSLSSTINSLPLALYNIAARVANRNIVPFSYTLGSEADTLTLKVLAEEAWTLTYKTSDNGNWVTFSETSGPATGANGKDITLKFEENTGGIRMVQIDIQSGQDHAAVNILQNR